MQIDNDLNTFQLDADETAHFESLPADIKLRLALLSQGAVITADIAESFRVDEMSELKDDPLAVPFLLTVNCSRLIRISVKSLLLGYLTGAATTIRASFDALLLLNLFIESPEEIASVLSLPSLDAGV